MRNLGIIARGCENDLTAIGIKIGYIDGYDVNSRATGRLGLCSAVRGRSRHFRIQIASALLDESIPLDELKNTVYHELLHTCPGCMNHGNEWQRQAAIVNRAYRTNISRCSGAEDVATQVMHERKMTSAKYKFVCEGCGRVHVNQRECGFTRNPGNYICGKCGALGRWKRIF